MIAAVVNSRKPDVDTRAGARDHVAAYSAAYYGPAGVPGAEPFPHSLIKSPLWSSLTTGHDPARAITRHDRSQAGPALTSRDIATGGRRITRLPASGL